MKKLTITLLVLLSFFAFLPTFAEEKTDTVSVTVEEVDGIPSVVLKGSIFKELNPTIEVYVELEEDVVLADPNGNRVAYSYNNGVLSFKASEAGSFALLDEDEYVQKYGQAKKSPGYVAPKTCID